MFVHGLSAILATDLDHDDYKYILDGMNALEIIPDDR